MACIVETAAGAHGLRGIAGLRGAAVLRLQEIQIAAASKVKRMTPRAAIAFLNLSEGRRAIAYGASEHLASSGTFDDLARLGAGVDSLSYDGDSVDNYFFNTFA